MFGGPGGGGPAGRGGNVLNQATLKPKNTSQTLGRLMKYFSPWWPMLIVALVSIVISTWGQVTTPELTGQLVDCYLTPSAASTFGDFPGISALASSSATSCWLAPGVNSPGTTDTLIKKAFNIGGFIGPKADASNMDTNGRIAGLVRVVLILVSIYIASALLTSLTFFSLNWSGQHVLRALREKVFVHLHDLPMSYYAENEAGDLMSRITNDAVAIEQAMNFALVNVLSGILLLVWIAYNMLTLNMPYALLAMAVTPIMLVATLYFSAQARKAFRSSRTSMGNVNAQLEENIAAVREVQAFNRAEENIENFRVTSGDYRDANVRAVSFSAALSPTLQALGYLALAIVTCAGGLALLGNGTLFGTAISLGLVITFLLYVQRFNQPIQQIAILWSNVQNAIAGAERIFGLLDVKPAIQDAKGAKEIHAIKGEVEFADVTAEYMPGQPVLKNVSFTAKPGQTIAIVGPTGAGKTTIMNLLPRFYDVTAGAVRVDGVDVRTVTAESLRRQIGIVLQDTYLFNTTVMENIRFGRPEATDDQVFAAAKLAHADTFIERLPEKYQTILGERGSGLSQGQRQLLAIARAALSDPRILVLDEATSSVDTRTERLIQEALVTLLRGRTSFVIAHRLSTIRNADMVLVVNDGEIIERGKHPELLEKKGFYYNLYMSQFRRDPQFVEALQNGHDGHKPQLKLDPPH
ncbi:MAG: ABC transporter ATP-binding protein [Anaerolineales bacterium]|jgi:ATP-binding cassette subfamily B protein